MKVLRNKAQTPNVCIIGLTLTETLGLVRRTWFQNSFKVFGILRQDSILSCTESHHQLKRQYSKLQHICLSPPSPSQMKRDALTGKPRLMKRETTSHLERVILSPEIQRMETAFSVTYLYTLPENVETKIKERNLVINNSNQDKPTRHLKQMRSSNQLWDRLTQLLVPCHNMHQNFIPTINKNDRRKLWANEGEPLKRDRVNSIGQETAHQKYKGQNDCGKN